MRKIIASLITMSIATTTLAESPNFAAKQLDLGIQLLNKSRGTSNPILSPFSAHSGLTLARFGARGTTAQELDRLLFGEELTTSDQARYAELCSRVSNPTESGVSTTVANSVWIASRSELQPEFLAKTKSLNSEARSIDFSDGERARATINSWVSDKTNARITEIIRPGSLSARTTVALVNALHFKGSWQEPFSKRGTRQEPFHTDGALETTNVPMMFTSAPLRYHESSDWQAVSLLYTSRRHAFLLLVPKRRLSTKQVLASLNSRIVTQALTSSDESVVELSMPRFAVRHSTDLASSLPDLGIPSLFSDKADLSALSTTPTIISTVPHEAFISVDEEGSEAAASTAVVGVLGKAPGSGGPKVVRADHPFAFAIIHLESKAPLFLGVVGDPRG